MTEEALKMIVQKHWKSIVYWTQKDFYQKLEELFLKLLENIVLN